MSTEYYIINEKIHLETLLARCPEIEIISHEGDEVIKFGPFYIHFYMDDDFMISGFTRYGGNNVGGFFELIEQRFAVKIIDEYTWQRECNEQIQAEENEFEKGKLKRMEKIEKDCKIDPTSSIALKEIVNEVLEKNRNVNVEKLEPKRFYRGVFRLFSQLPLENFIDADDDSFDNAVVLYKEFLGSEFNSVWGFNSFNDEVLAINQWLEHTYSWVAKRISSNNAPF